MLAIMTILTQPSVEFAVSHAQLKFQVFLPVGDKGEIPELPLQAQLQQHSSVTVVSTLASDSALGLRCDMLNELIIHRIGEVDQGGTDPHSP